MPEPSGSTGAQPSAEAIEDVAKMMKAGEAQGHSIAARAHDVAFATLRVDAPVIHAAGVQEGRAAMLREVVEWVDEAATIVEDSDEADALLAALDAIEARFPSEGTT